MTQPNLLRCRRAFLPWSGFLLWLCLASVFSAEDRVNFNTDIRPILSDKCYACHGPDENKREAKLRLDTREGAFRVKDGTAIVQPGKPDGSELFRRITHSDPDEKMPPSDSNLSLTQSEIELFRRWISEGAEWEKHWAFVPLQPVQVPAVKDPEWPINDIDHFVLSRIEQEGIETAPEATREKWIRRVTFDLTGLPPTLPEIDAFLADDSDQAHAKVVDRLLASSAYGERMTSDWLDIARYSDTHGYQADRYRAMWPWRDWVIKSFNENLPYNEFVTWQLAGDLIPDPTKDQVLATAFNRHHMQTEEGGSVEEEFRVSYVVDRLNTMGTAFLGLTLECSRCHDHKFDPISQKEYYQLYSFFNNIDESGQASHFTDSMPVPTLLLSDDAADQKLARLKTTIRTKESKAEPLRENARAAFAEWLETRPKDPILPGLIASIDFDELKENKAANSVNSGKPANAVEGPELIDGGKHGKAVKLNGENGFTLNGLGAFSRADAFTIGLWIKTPSIPNRAVLFHRSMAALDAASRGYEMLMEQGNITLGLHHMWPGNAMKVRSVRSIPTNEWVHLVMSYDGSSRADGLKLYWNGEEAETEVIRDNLWKDITYERGDPQLTIGYRFRDNGFRDGQVDAFRVFDRQLAPIEIEELFGSGALKDALAASDLSGQKREKLLDYYLATANPIYQTHLADLRELRREQSRFINPIPEVMAMKEMAEPRPTFILKRGAYDAPGERVTADTPAAILPFENAYPRNRLGLTQWLFARENPLTARVAANRLWQVMFGRGIVATSDNFGSQGEIPTHPELLDWLANDLRDHGWNIKRFLRQIALSATYRQCSTATPEAISRDPENDLLARAPAYRMSAEMLRDNALASSGLLVSKIGGAPVKPYQPAGLWEEKSGASYVPDKGEGLYRRSLYTFWKRTSPPPSMIAFDAAERNVCIMWRQVTSTPLQALALLNDPQLVEASRWIAERMLKEGGGNYEDQLAWGFRLLTGRSAKSSEMATLRQLYQEQKSIFSENQSELLKLLTVGEKLNDPALAPVELGACTIVASALLNYDETIMKR